MGAFCCALFVQQEHQSSWITVDGICQYKIDEAIGNTFDECARRFVRKDPDIILSGEIGDEKTARTVSGRP